MHSHHKRAPVVKYTSEYIEELDCKAFYIGRLIPSWPRKKTGGAHHHKTPAHHHKTPAHHLKINIEFKLLFGILREIVPDSENTAIRRAIIDDKPPPTFDKEYTNPALLKFIKKFNVKTILAPKEMILKIPNVIVDHQHHNHKHQEHHQDHHNQHHNQDHHQHVNSEKKYDLVIALHCDMLKYAEYSNKYIIGYYFNTTPERLDVYRKLYIAVKGETPTIMNISRDTIRETMHKSGLKFMAETEDIKNINNTLNAYAICYTVPHKK